MRAQAGRNAGTIPSPISAEWVDLVHHTMQEGPREGGREAALRWQAATGSDPVREGTRKRGREGLWKEGRRTRESDISAYLQRRGTDRDTTMKVTQMGGREWVDERERARRRRRRGAGLNRAARSNSKSDSTNKLDHIDLGLVLVCTAKSVQQDFLGYE